jgi:hypothetical protein
MKNRSIVLLVVVCLVGLLLGACATTEKEVRTQNVSVIVATPRVELNKTAQVVLYGTGFAPKQEVLFVFKDTGGVQTVISADALKPLPVPDEAGTWVTVWDVGQYLSLLKPGNIVLNVTDGNYKTLTQIPVSFFAVEKKEKK